MYCKNCGNEVNDNAYICVNCGAKIESEVEKESNGTTLGIIGICFGLFIPLVTFICSGIGLGKAFKTKNTQSKVLNFIGLGLAVARFIYNIVIMLEAGSIYNFY